MSAKERTSIAKKIVLVDDTEGILKISYTTPHEDVYSIKSELFVDKKLKICLQFSAECYKVGYGDRYTLVGVLDSISSDLGEVGYQLYGNDKVERFHFPTTGYLLVTTGYIKTDSNEDAEITYEEDVIKFLQSFNEHIIRKTIQGFMEIVPLGKSCITYAYYGELRRRNSFDREWAEVFKKAGFAVFKCAEGLCSDGKNYVAAYISKATTSNRWQEKLASVEWSPKIKDYDDDEDY